MRSIFSFLRNFASRLRSNSADAVAAPVKRDSSEPDALPLGRDENGRYFELDFKTGTVRRLVRGHVMQSGTQWVPPIEELAVAAERAGFVTELEGNHLNLETDIGIVMVVRDPRHLLRFIRLYEFADEVEEEDREGVAAELNRSALVARYVYYEDRETIHAEYDQPMASGMTDEQWIAMLRAFVTNVAISMSKTRAIHFLV